MGVERRHPAMKAECPLPHFWFMIYFTLKPSLVLGNSIFSVKSIKGDNPAQRLN
jgi:hypothetical protein